MAIDENKSIIGYGCIRTVSDNSLLIGPLYANDQSTAISLMIELICHYYHKVCFL